MTGDFGDLYQEIILDHGRSPRNHHAMDCPPARSAEGFNPFCGDRLTLFVRTSEDRIDDVSFQGEGCAISQAAASMLTEAIKGRTTQEARDILTLYQRALTEPDSGGADRLGHLAALLGVRRFPMRVKCATLAAHTLRAALEGGTDPVTTE